MSTKRILLLSCLCLFLLAGCQLIGGGEESPPVGDPEVGGGIDAPQEGDLSEPPADGEEAALPENGAESENGGEETTSPPAPEALPRFDIVAGQQIMPPMVSTLPAGTTVQHQIVQGEWLHQIARCYGASYEAVLALNPLPNPNFITPERVVTVPNIGSEGLISGPPCVQSYMVQMGDSFASLAQQYGSTPDVLQRANPGALFTGRVVFVPDNRLTVVATDPPMLAQTMLFNSDGDLAVWHAGGELEIFFDQERYLLDIATNRQGNFVLTKQSSDGIEMDVVLLDRAGNTAVILESSLPTDVSAPFQENMVIAEDGQNGAFLVRDGSSFRVVAFATGNPEGKQSRGIGHDVLPEEIPQLFVGPNNGRFYLLDRTGIYEYSYTLDAEPRQLHAIDPENFSLPLLFSALVWSPTGRYLLLQGNFLEGGVQFVMDSETGNLAEVEGTGSYIIRNDSGWRPDGRLLVLNNGFGENPMPETAVYLPQTDGDGNLMLTQESNSALTLPDEGAIGFGFSTELPPVQPNNEQLTALLNTAVLNSPGLFQTAAGDTTLNRVSSFSDQFGLVNWSLDGRSAIVQTFPTDGGAGDVVYVSLDASQPYSLVDWLGFQIADFQWISGN